MTRFLTTQHLHPMTRALHRVYGTHRPRISLSFVQADIQHLGYKVLQAHILARAGIPEGPGNETSNLMVDMDLSDIEKRTLSHMHKGRMIEPWHLLASKTIYKGKSMGNTEQQFATMASALASVGSSPTGRLPRTP